ncbi:MAG: phospholipid carrier-dependent glycosyltransferase [Propionicimonas sp.]
MTPDDSAAVPGDGSATVWGPPDPGETVPPAAAPAAAWPPAAPPPTTVQRLRDGLLTDRLAGWLVTLGITALAFVIRLVNLGYPSKLVFDETYYAKDAWTLWKSGFEKAWPDGAQTNDSVVAGNADIFLDKPAFIVHPPVGKWLIGFGEQLFGMNSFGWRFMPLVFGTLLVFVTIRLARRLSRSTLIGGIAGILLTLDGLAFTMSRIALLDVFQAFFIVAAVACCVADRDWYRHRLADLLDARGLRDFGGSFGPLVWLRPWRLAAGLMFGLAIGTKWNSVYALAAMGVLCVWWDVRARNLAGAGWKGWLALVFDGVPAFLRMVVVAVVVYVASWAGWLTTDGGWGRDWGAKHPDDPLTIHLGEMWASFLHYHQDIYNFHTGDYINQATHPYSSHPISWLFMTRPLGIDAISDIQPGVEGCHAEAGQTCIRVISAMGTPVLWWLAAIALIVAVIWWIGGRDWRFGVPVVAALSTYLPWFGGGGRPLFFFYAITMIPFTAIALALVLGLIMGPANGRYRRRGAIVAGLAVGLVALNFAWIYPVLTDGLLVYQTEYLARMWLRSWI